MKRTLPILSALLFIALLAPGFALGPSADHDPDRRPGALRAERDLLVSSRGTSSVKRYDGETGEYIGDFVAAGAGGLNATQEVAYGPDGHLYVSGRFTDSILKFDGRTGEFIGSFTSGYALDEPTKFTFGPDGYLYVSQWGQENRTIARFDGETGAFVDEFTPALDLACDHAWDDEGNLYVVNYGSHDVHRFDAEGNFIDVFVSPSNFQGPVNLWFDDGGDLLVADWETGTVKRFDGETGAYKSDFISGMTRTEGVVVGPDGDLYICDWQMAQINRYDPETGALKEVFASGGGMIQPNGVVFMPVQEPTAAEGPDDVPGQFTLEQNYPNPFNPTTTIRYILPRPARVTLTVFDAAGRTVDTLVQSLKEAGPHEVAFDATDLPGGTYLYRLEAPGVRLSNTMTVVK
jgi:DNA-binding beta-propeller fold protein YncE